jgi:hypothetical protein
MEVATNTNPNIRGAKKATKATKGPSNPPSMKKKFREKFINNDFLKGQIRDGNLKDVFDELIEFKEKNNFKDRTFVEVLKYDQGKGKDIVKAIDKLLLSSNEAEFMENINKLGSKAGLTLPILEKVEGQQYKDIKPSDIPLVKGDKTKVEKMVEDMKQRAKSQPTPKPSPVPKALPKESSSPSATTGKEEAFTEKEISEMMEREGVNKKEAIKRLKLERAIEDPTFAPDEMLTAKEDIEEEKKAQKEAKEARPITGMTAQEEEELLNIPEKPKENVTMKMKKQDRKTEIDDLKPLPSKSDFIPPMRLGTRGKDLKDLLEDIMFFMKNFKGQLKKEAEFLKKVDTSNIDQVRELHNRIVGKLAPKESKEREGKRIGVVVNADEYIREQMKKILQEQVFSSLRPDDVVIDVGSRTSEGRDTKDFGDFAIKRTIDGGLASSREAIFRYMPNENDEEVVEKGQTEKQRKKPNRLSLPKPRLNNERTNAIRMNVRNPFRVPQKTMKLKYLY